MSNKNQLCTHTHTHIHTHTHTHTHTLTHSPITLLTNPPDSYPVNRLSGNNFASLWIQPMNSHTFNLKVYCITLCVQESSFMCMLQRKDTNYREHFSSYKHFNKLLCSCFHCFYNSKPYHRYIVQTHGVCFRTPRKHANLINRMCMDVTGSRMAYPILSSKQFHPRWRRSRESCYGLVDNLDTFSTDKSCLVNV